MAWILIIGFLIFLWFISLSKVLLVSRKTSSNYFMQEGRTHQKRNVLLVVAHPDDESMLYNAGLLCICYQYSGFWFHTVLEFCSISAGNADGKGNIRKRELYQACAALKITWQQVKTVDHPDMQDGFGKVWDHNLVAKLIEEEISSLSIDVIITFDTYGVSGHCNHRDVHYGVRKLLHDTSQRDIEAWELVSTNILRKYSGPVDVWLSMFFAILHKNGTMQCFVNKHSRRSFLAMAQHSSQWVWFRKLFVALSSYTYMNTLRKIK